MISDKLISTQCRINFTKYLQNYSLYDIYKFIKNGNYNFNDLIQPTKMIQAESNHDKQNILKAKLLPYACINGRFKERSDDSLIEYSCYTAIDFDKFSSEDELLQVAYWLTEVPCIKMIFRSPSGKGLKAIVEHTNTNPEKHRFLYKELLQMFFIAEVDTKVSDISRATYLCYDPFVWWNESCVPYQFDENKYSEDTIIDHCKNGNVVSNSCVDMKCINSLSCDDLGITDGSIKRIIGKWIRRDDIKTGNRNNKLYKYGCKLCKAGVKFDYALQMLFEEFVGVGLTEKEIFITASNAYNKCRTEFGSERKYYGKKK